MQEFIIRFALYNRLQEGSHAHRLPQGRENAPRYLVLDPRIWLLTDLNLVTLLRLHDVCGGEGQHLSECWLRRHDQFGWRIVWYDLDRHATPWEVNFHFLRRGQEVLDILQRLLYHV